MQRQHLLDALASTQRFDLAVVGGGATGLGVALDAVTRGLKVVLLEARDFAAGTSSRATKLVHGGVRYLAQGNIGLVREALHERTTLLRNAPHLAQPLAFVMPSYRWWETPLHTAGLTAYDLLAGRAGLGRTQVLGVSETLRSLPNLRPEGLKGGVRYWDGQFDDARLALALARTAAAQGALLVNHCPVTQLLHDGPKVVGLVCADAESGLEFRLQAGCVVNATGVWVDQLRRLDGQAQGREAATMVAPSQGVHLVVDRDFLPGHEALMVPRTADGRVLFGVPWLGKLILGTTDTPREDLPLEPQPFRHEVDFILNEAARYLARAPSRADVRSLWVGLRPLVNPGDGDDGAGTSTAGLTREHTVRVAHTGLVTVTGGKWTTYRAMAEDVLEECVRARLLPKLGAAVTADLPLFGAPAAQVSAMPIAAPPGLHLWGSEAAAVAALPGSDVELSPGLSEAMVRYAVRHEWGRTVEDMLARRFRLLFLDARAAATVAPRVAVLLREETGADPQLAAFEALATQYSQWPEA